MQQFVLSLRSCDRQRARISGLGGNAGQKRVRSWRSARTDSGLARIVGCISQYRTPAGSAALRPITKSAAAMPASARIGSPPFHAYAARAASALARSGLPRACLMIFSAWSFEMDSFEQNTRPRKPLHRLSGCGPVCLVSTCYLPSQVSSYTECRSTEPRQRFRRQLGP
jgi:hypothetical protein